MCSTRTDAVPRGEYRVVDADFHLHAPIENVYDYVDDPMVREKLDRFGPPPMVTSGWNIEYTTEVERSDGYDRAQGSAADRDEILEVKDELGLDEVVVTPGTHFPFNSGRYPVIKDHLARAYNEYLRNEVIDVDQGIYGMMTVPHENVDAAVEEIDRVGSDDGFVGVHREFSLSRPMGHVEFDPLFEAMTSLDLPLVMHIGNPRTGRFDLVSDSMRTFVGGVITGVSYGLFANVLNMIMTGVFDEYPDLDVLFQEAGTNWMAYIAARADELYQAWEEDVRLSERMYESGRTYLERLPSEYLFDNMYVTTQPIALPNRGHLTEAMLELNHAEETFVFATDWPHSTFDVPEWVFTDPRINEDLRERILHGNAETVLRLPR